MMHVVGNLTGYSTRGYLTDEIAQLNTYVKQDLPRVSAPYDLWITNGIKDFGIHGYLLAGDMYIFHSVEHTLSTIRRHWHEKGRVELNIGGCALSYPCWYSICPIVW